MTKHVIWKKERVREGTISRYSIIQNPFESRGTLKSTLKAFFGVTKVLTLFVFAILFLGHKFAYVKLEMRGSRSLFISKMSFLSINEQEKITTENKNYFTH